MTDKNFGLTEDEFDMLVSELKEGKEKLFEKIFLSQFENSLNHVMIKYKASREISYDACMDSLIYLRKLLIEGKLHYGNLRALYNQMSAQRYLKYINKQKKTQLVDQLPEVMIEEQEDREDALRLLNGAWDKLGEECKKILKNYYYDNQKLYDIADTIGKTPAAIRKQKERCINTLRLNFRQTV